MNKERFIHILKQTVREPAIAGTMSTLLEPPGRKPPRQLVNLSEWFKTLSEEDRSMVKQVVAYAVDGGLYRFLTILDRVSVMDEEPLHGQLELYYTKGDFRILLNSAEGEFLYNIFKWPEGEGQEDSRE